MHVTQLLHPAIPTPRAATPWLQLGAAVVGCAMLGPAFSNRPWNNWVNWTVIALFFVLSLILAIQVILPDMFSAG